MKPMNLQYISDGSGKITAVLIPINEWNELKSKYAGIENEDDVIPQWQIKEVRKRLKEYKKKPDQAVDFDAAMEDIEKNI